MAPRRLVRRGTLPGGTHWSSSCAAATMPAPDRRRRRRQRRHALLQPAQPARALQHARHAEVPAHLQADARPLPVLGHGAHLLLDRRRHVSAGTTRSAATPTRAMVAERWGHQRYQEHRNDWTLNGHDSFLVEGGKYGLGRRDLAANVNWFSKVAVARRRHHDLRRRTTRSAGDARRPALRDGHAGAAAHLPAPARPGAEYPRRPVRYQLSQADPVAADDYCRNFRPGERARLREQPHLPPRARRGAAPRDSRRAPPKPTLEARPPRRVYRRRRARRRILDARRCERGQTLRIVDLEGNQAVDTLFYNADDPAERYSAVDTIRAQGNVYLSVGSQLRSTSGNVMLEIVADTVGRHDTLGGACATRVEHRALRAREEDHARLPRQLAARRRREPARRPRPSATSRHNINFFMNVPVTARRRPDLRRRHLRARQVRRAARRDGRASR